MALIQCEECKKEISDKAEVCPHCGCPTNIDLFLRDLAEKAYNKQISKEQIVEELKKNDYLWEEFVVAYNKYDKQQTIKKNKEESDAVSAIIGIILFIVIVVWIVLVLVENDGYFPLFTITGNATITSK